MDDLRPLEFEVAGFIRVVSIGAGDGRISSAAAARSASNVLSATEALTSFAAKAKSRSGDVIAAYLALVPQATQLFAPLWLADKYPAIASAALDVLILVARYARAGEAPQQAVAAARSVVKDIVKGRAPNLFHVVKNDKKLLAKKALILLEIVASSHRILAKEVVHRFDLTSAYFVQALCNKYNRICRNSFLKLVITLLASGDYDLVWYLSTRGKDILTYAASVVSYLASHRPVFKLARKQREGGQTDVQQSEMEAAKLKVRNDATEADELAACIAFISAVRDNILTCPNENTVRAALEPPFVDHLATVSATELQILASGEEDNASIANMMKRKALRDITTALFVQIGKSKKASKSIFLARALGTVPVAHSPTALKFVLSFVESCPHVAIPLLQAGPFLASQPNASSTWLSHAAVIMACTKRLTKPTTAFIKHHFFERTLNHDSALVQHVGVLAAAMLCRLVEQDDSFAQAASSFLPPLRFVDKLLRRYPGDPTIHSVFSSYRKLFAKEFVETNTDAIRLVVEASGSDISVTEATIRVCLAYSRETALNSIFQKRVLSTLIKSAWSPRNSPSRTRKIWRLVQHILQTTNLFPAQSGHELDVWLAGLSAQGDDRELCLESFEHMLQTSWKQPYALFDDASGIHNSPRAVEELTTQRNSLLTAAALRRLSKLHSANARKISKEADAFPKFLACVLTALVSWDFVVGRDNTKSLVLSKLEVPEAAGVSLLVSKKTRKQLQEAVQNLRVLNEASPSAEFFALREVCIIGEFLSCLYEDSGLSSLSELSSIWGMCCSGIADVPAVSPIGVEFFSKHWRKLAKSKTTDIQIVESFLKVLCVRHISAGGAEYNSLSSDESMRVLKVLLKENMAVEDLYVFFGHFSAHRHPSQLSKQRPFYFNGYAVWDAAKFCKPRGRSILV